MYDIYNLQRFIKAQENSFKIALKEIQNGKKRSHWMWFIFPQIVGLGMSSFSRKYSIKNKKEAKDYLNHNILGNRLIEITNTLMKIEQKSIISILGYPDNLKLKSSMTLFKKIAPDNKLFSDALVKYFNGQVCEHTDKFF